MCRYSFAWAGAGGGPVTSAYEDAGVTVDSEGRRRGFRNAYEIRLSSSSSASMSTSISEPAVDDDHHRHHVGRDGTMAVRAGSDRAWKWCLLELCLMA